MTAYEARRRFDEAVASRDRLEAELALSDMKAYVAELEAVEVAAGVRDLELWLMARQCWWWWSP